MQDTDARLRVRYVQALELVHQGVRLVVADASGTGRKAISGI